MVRKLKGRHDVWFNCLVSKIFKVEVSKVGTCGFFLNKPFTSYVYETQRQWESNSVFAHLRSNSVSNWNVCGGQTWRQETLWEGEPLVNYLYNEIKLFRSHLILLMLFQVIIFASFTLLEIASRVRIREVWFINIYNMSALLIKRFSGNIWETF